LKIAPAALLLAAAAAALMGVRNAIATDGGEVAPAPSVAAAPAARPVAAAVAVDLPETRGGREAVIRKESDGHFWVNAYVNGAPVHFMVDTGASIVALTERDARRAGIDPSRLPRDMAVSTAAGRVMVASVMLNTVRIERVTATQVQAAIVDEGLEHSLLGMSFLNKLDGWEVTSRALVIRQ
jgi:aspartyl protease family protein